MFSAANIFSFTVVCFPLGVDVSSQDTGYLFAKTRTLVNYTATVHDKLDKRTYMYEGYSKSS